MVKIGKKEFLPRMGRIQKKMNIDGNIYRLRLVADKQTVDTQVLWYWKKKIETAIRKTAKGYELWVNER